MDKQQNLDNLFRVAREQEPVVSFGETSTLFLSAIQVNMPKSKVKNSSLLTKKWIIMILSTTILSLSLFLIPSNEANPTKYRKMETLKPQSSENQKTVSTVEPTKNFNPAKQPAKSLFENLETLINEPIDLIISQSFQDVEEAIFIPRFWKDEPKDDYVIPNLSEEEIAANNKQKKSMLKALEKFDKKIYAYIPSGTFEFNGKTTSVQSFYMQKTEVSNLEYRTFLFDLLIQGRKDEFLKARPDHKQWSILLKQENSPLENHYFSHPAYDHYPVVNITREGAEMYCKWISQELIKSVDEKKKNQYNDVRIPLRVEWVKAASVEGKQLPYPWDGQYIRNSDGAIMANCVIGYTEDTLNLNFDASSPAYDVMAPVKSYWPNEYDIYNLAGNASEMVYEEINMAEPGTIGGSWRTYFDGIKILAPDEYKGVISPMPTIGFRVVMTYINK